jgi:hypothetical protein
MRFLVLCLFLFLLVFIFVDNVLIRLDSLGDFAL